MFGNVGKRLYQELEAPKEATRFGAGWISGVIALPLSMFALLSILILYYPGYLTVPELREQINVDMIRLLIRIAIITGFVFACISLLLREYKFLGLASAILIFISIIMGGSAAKQVATDAGGISLGLDWFLLNLLLTGIIFLPLERLFRRIDQSVFRKEWRTDLLYFFISSILVQFLTYLSMLPVTKIMQFASLETIQAFVSQQNLILQFIAVMFLTDFVQYWVHRLFHQVPFLWKFHAIHHSAEAMDWLAGSRMHVIEIIVLRALTVIPMYVLGFSEVVIYAYIILVYLYATYVHANLRFNVEWLKPFIVTPRFHHWHHGIEKEAIDVNFAVHFPVLDRIFGTYYMPKNQWPSGYGALSTNVPAGFFRQFVFPFIKN